MSELPWLTLPCKADISTLQKSGHFYFALTLVESAFNSPYNNPASDSV
jgi:hypothetical protein